jgi:hypothetical protein
VFFSTLPAAGPGCQPSFSLLCSLEWCYAIRRNTPQGSYVRRWLVSKSELMGWSSSSDFSQATSSRNTLSSLRNVAEWSISCDIPMHCHAELCGPSSHNRAKRTISKQIIGLNTRNNSFNPSMTCPKSLSRYVTLLVRPGIEPKIARFSWHHGESCGRGLNLRYGPPQNPPT